MKRKDWGKRLLAGLLPSALIITALPDLPALAQEVASEQEQLPADLNSDAANNQEAGSESVLPDETAADKNPALTEDIQETEPELPVLQPQELKETQETATNETPAPFAGEPVGTVPLEAQASAVVSLDSVLSQFQDCALASGYFSSVILPESISAAVVSWPEVSDLSAAPKSNEQQPVTIQLTLADSWEFAKDIALPEGWTLSVDASGRTGTLSGTARFHKETIHLEKLPENGALSTHCRNWNTAYRYIPFELYLNLITESGTTIPCSVSYDCADYNMEPAAVNTVTWELNLYDVPNAEDYTFESPVSGTVLLSNPDPLPVTVDVFDGSATWSGAPIDISTMFSGKNLGAKTYYLIEDGKEPQRISRGLFIPSRAGTFTIEMRAETAWPYANPAAQGEITIYKGNASNEPEASIDNWVYGSSPNTPSIYSSIFDVSQAEIRYRVLGTGGSVIPSSSLDAGVYEMVVDFMETELYKAASLVVQFTVEKAQPSRVEQGSDPFVVGSSDQKVPFTFQTDGKITVTSSDPQTATVDDQGFVHCLKAGSVTLTVEAAEGANYLAAAGSCEITIGKKEREWKGDLALSKTYGDEDFLLDLSVSTDPAEGALSPAITISKDVLVKAADGKLHIAKAGTAAVTVTFPETDLYKEKTQTVQVTVAPKPIEVSADSKTKTYGDQDPVLTWSAPELVGLDALEGIVLSRTPGENAGEYAITASASSDLNPNYQLVFKPAILTIEPKEAVLAWSSTSLSYNGQIQAPSAQVSNLAAGESCEVLVGKGQKDAGSGYTVRADSLSNSNYKLPEDASCTFSIARKAAKIDVEAKKTYGDSDPQYTPVISGLIEGDSIGSLQIARSAGETVGRYPLSLSDAAALNPNYDFSFDGTLEITPRPVTVRWDTEKLVYSGQPQLPQYVLEGVLENDACAASVSGEQTHAGTDYTAAIEAIDNANYTLDEQSATLSYEIAPKPAAIIIDDAQKTYGDADPSFAFKTDGLLGNDTAGSGSIVREAGESAGSYELNLSSDSALNPDYDFEVESGTLTIAPKTASIVWSSDPLIYNGSLQAPAAAVSNLLDGDSCEVEVDGAQIHAGKDFVAKAVSLSNPNYVLSENEQKPFEIVPTSLKLTALSDSKTYGQDDPKLSWKAEGLIGQDVLEGIEIGREEGEDAGEYAIKVSCKEGSNPDYEIVFENGVFTIEPASVEDFKIVLKDLLREDGQQKTQTIEEIEGLTSEDFELSDHQNSKGGAYRLRLNGKGNYTGSIDQSYVVLPGAPKSFARNSDGSAQIGSGSVAIDWSVESGLPESSLRSEHEDLLNLLADHGLIHPMDLAAIADGDQKVIPVTMEQAASRLPQSEKDILAAVSSTWNSPAFRFRVDSPFAKAQSLKGNLSVQIAIPQDAPNSALRSISLENTALRVAVYRIDSGVPVQTDCTMSADGTSLLLDADLDGVYVLSGSVKIDPPKTDEPDKEPDKPVQDEPNKPDDQKKTDPSSSRPAPVQKPEDSKEKPAAGPDVKTASFTHAGQLMAFALFGALGAIVFKKKKDEQNDQ